jgi:hypothetical protein
LSNCGSAQISGRRRENLFLICGSLFLLGAAVNTACRWGTLTHRNLLAPPEEPDSWQVYTAGVARASLRREGTALRLDIGMADGVTRHVQCFQRGIDLREGHSYTLQFRARADAPRDVWVEAHLDQPDYHNVGLGRVAPLVPEWQAFTETFRATRVLASDTGVPCFVVGGKAGTVWLADISLNEATPAEDAGRAGSPSPPRSEGRLKGTKEVHGDL